MLAGLYNFVHLLQKSDVPGLSEGHHEFVQGHVATRLHCAESTSAVLNRSELFTRITSSGDTKNITPGSFFPGKVRSQILKVNGAKEVVYEKENN